VGGDGGREGGREEGGKERRRERVSELYNSGTLKILEIRILVLRHLEV
jgi:hypothetical protein